jgi:hypothetical protein
MPPDVGADEGRPAVPIDGPARWRIPFWAFQVLELGVAFLLVTQSIHVGRGGLLVGAGVVLALLALSADGPLGVVRLCGQRLHLVLVVSVAITMGALALVPALRPDAEGLLVIGGAVVALVFLATRTTVARGSRGRGRRTTRGGPVIDTTATVVTTGDPVPDMDAPGPDQPDSALRRAGRTTGVAAAAGKRAVDGHRPQVEDSVKRTLRGAGRLAGKLTGPKEPPAGPAADRDA